MGVIGVFRVGFLLKNPAKPHKTFQSNQRMTPETPANKGGRPKDALVPVTLKLLPAQHAWLDELAASGFHNTTKEGLLTEWIVDRLRQLRDAGEIHSTLPAESKIVSMKDSPDTQEKKTPPNLGQKSSQ